jgi:EAL domain-containing protein (putative c-di-GMP-specific phosphodiesterase class I)
LRALGVKIDMDDFGTGYSSLSCLHEFPIDVLKIDRAFVANATYERNYDALLHAILTLADHLRMQVVAEGIESVEQLSFLQALGCQFGQGYYFSSPLLPEEFGQFVATYGQRAAINQTVDFSIAAGGPLVNFPHGTPTGGPRV